MRCPWRRCSRIRSVARDLLGFRASNRDITKRKSVEEREGVYRKMVYDRENRLIGAVMLGDTSDLAEVTRTTSEPAKEP